jgi:glycosyltransferase involved in cell wall biosynthesis
VNVLLVTEWFPPAWNAGGTVVSAWNLARALAGAGAGTTVVTTDAYTGPPGSVPREREEAGVKILTSRVLRAAGERAHRYGLAPRIGRELGRASGRADVCIMQGLWTWPVAVASRICSRRGLPYVLSAKGTLDAAALGRRALKKRLYRRLVAASVLRNAAAFHFASERERDRSAEALRQVPGVVIPNGFETRPLAPRRDGELRARLGLPADSLLVGMAGRVHPVKGFDTIVPALARTGARIHLVIFGSDHERHLPGVLALAEACGASARVHALGHLEPGARDGAYASIDVLAMPSLGETFGNVAVECLLQGTPVIVSDQVPLAPYIEAHGLGAVVPALDPAAWASALDRWEDAPLRLDRASAAARVARDFALDVMAERWLEVLRPLARRERGREERQGI